LVSGGEKKKGGSLELAVPGGGGKEKTKRKKSFPVVLRSGTKRGGKFSPGPHERRTQGKAVPNPGG